MPTIPPTLAGIHSSSIPRPLPSPSRNLNSVLTYAAQNPSALLIIAVIIIILLALVQLYRYPRRHPVVTMSTYPTTHEKSSGRSSPPPSTKSEYSPPTIAGSLRTPSPPSTSQYTPPPSTSFQHTLPPLVPAELEFNPATYKPDPLPPVPTIRRHSYPIDTPSNQEGGDRQTVAEPQGLTRGGDMAGGEPRFTLPPPWVPGRTDTVVKLNNCRRHVMVLDGQAFRRGSEGS
ncbi:hypothetical protein MMC19_006082 [Ptychographa xylographoides]|nr:hypothetical protein [Ptychographa xylographoides]